MSKRKKYTHKKAINSHNLNFFHQQHHTPEIKGDEETEEPPALCIELPYPLHLSFTKDNHDHDAVQELLLKKTKYKKLEAFVKKELRSTKRKIDTTSDTLPAHIVKYCRLKDPDPYFKSDYNEYYTGGNLDYFEMFNSHYLVRPSVDNRLFFTNVNTGDSFFQDLSFRSPIFGLRALKTHQNVMFLARQKYKITVLLTRSLEQQTLTVAEVGNDLEIPVIDAKINPFDVNNLVCIDFDHHIETYDIGRTDVIANVDCRPVTDLDYFSQLEYLNINTLLCANRRGLRILDDRVFECVYEDNLDLEPCNSICAMKLDKNQRIVHISTRHDLYKYDTRNRQCVENCSHMLAVPPCYIDLLEEPNGTFTYLSGQSVDQKVIFGDRGVDTLPLNVPSIIDTYHETRLRRDLLLRRDIESKLKVSVTGIKLLSHFETNNEGKVLYSSNSQGQLFKQRIIHDADPDMYKSVDKLFNWIDALPRERTKLYAISIANLPDVLNKVAGLNPISVCEEPETVKSKKPEKFLRDFEAKFNEDEFSGLATEFMSIWKEDGALAPVEVETEGDELKEKGHYSRVSDWLERQNFESDLDLE